MPVVAVGAVVVVGPATIVLIQRGTPPNAGSWTLPGGKVARGEALADAVRREVREETGLEVEVGALVEVVELVSTDHHYVVLDFAARATGGVLRAGDDAADARAVSLDELDAYAVTDAVARVVRSALAAG